MATVSLEEAQANLPDLIERLAPGEELTIIRGGQSIAKLIAQPHRQMPREPSNCRGWLTIVSEDDDHLEDFAEYMP